MKPDTETTPRPVRAPLDTAESREADGAQATNEINIRTDPVNVTGQSESVAEDQITMNASIQESGKKRLKREAVEPLISQHLMRRPHDTAKRVADTVGCSVGVVAESKTWKLNQKRLKLAKQQSVEPKAMKLDERTINAVGGGAMRQLHNSRLQADGIIDQLDEAEKALFQRIGEFETRHPDATPQEVASALGCTAGEVERRQATLHALAAEQSTDELEDIDVEDADTKRGTKRKWVQKRL